MGAYLLGLVVFGAQVGEARRRTDRRMACRPARVVRPQARNHRMIDLKQTLQEAALSGTLAGLFSAAVLLACGKRETGSAVAPVNAESHWLWGDESLHEDSATLRHTLAGFVTHQLSTLFWAGLMAFVRSR